MSQIQGAPKYCCSFLAVFSGRRTIEDEQSKDIDSKIRYPFPDLVSSGRLEVNFDPFLSFNWVKKVSEQIILLCFLF